MKASWRLGSLVIWLCCVVILARCDGGAGKEAVVEKAAEAGREGAWEERAETAVERPEGREAVADGGGEGKEEEALHREEGGALPDGGEAMREAVQEGQREALAEGLPEGGGQDLCGQGEKSYPFGQDSVRVSCVTGAGGRRSYVMRTTHALRDNDPSSKEIRFAEGADDPLLRSGNLLFDALFSMTLEEVRQLNVQAVYEGGFNNGQPVSCACFQTGAKWTWAWTRDTAYAVDLGLAWLDPARSEATLRFKLSGLKASVAGGRGGAQIVQDTGTGGAWPVSSDRLTWALAARKLSWALDSAKRSAFLQEMYPILVQTLAQDREMIFDAEDGLYRGEQSFLDWREQSYPSWTRERLEHIAMSKALSTNLAHLIAIQWTAEIAQGLGKAAEATQYQGWADALRQAIRRELYREAAGLHSTIKTTLLDGGEVAKYDLLGQSLAILEGGMTKAEAEKAIGAYSVSAAGPPVIWPQQPLIPIYHNRAIWPFVTAYWARAAHRAGHAESLAHSLRSLVRGAALNLSNMENLEWMTGKNWVDDGVYSGPVVNSRRQLWSVAGYLGAVVESLVGWQIEAGGVRLRPMIPKALHREGWLGERVLLTGLPYQGRKIEIELQLPSVAGGDGAYAVESISLDGVLLSPSDALVTVDRLSSQSRFVVKLRDAQEAAKPLKVVQDTGDFRTMWSPREPQIQAITVSGQHLALQLDAQGESGVVLDVFRDGQRIATGIAPGLWEDTTAQASGGVSYCYSAEAIFPSSGHRSQHALPRCWKGVGDAREQIVDAWHLEAVGGGWSDHAGGAAYQGWGDRDHRLVAHRFQPYWTGRYHIDLLYRNDGGSRNTGITCAVKRVQIVEVASNTVIATRWVAMPHTERTPLSASTGFWVTLDASKRYRIQIDESPDWVHNMTFLEHFSIYNGRGGGAEPWNRVEVAGIRLWPKEGQGQIPTTGQLLRFDGAGDYDKFAASQQLTPAIPLEAWERVALTWDEDWLYIAIVNRGFASDLPAYMIYIESATGAFSPAQGSLGMTYLQQSAHFPFTPTHLLGVRHKSDNGDGFGAWNGLWRRDAAGSWALQQRLRGGRDIWYAADRHTIAYRIHRLQLGSPTRIRLAAHLVYAQPANEWKAMLPTQHTPWQAASSGYYEIDLSGSKGVSNWQLR